MVKILQNGLDTKLFQVLFISARLVMVSSHLVRIKVFLVVVFSLKEEATSVEYFFPHGGEALRPTALIVGDYEFLQKSKKEFYTY